MSVKPEGLLVDIKDVVWDIFVFALGNTRGYQKLRGLFP